VIEITGDKKKKFTPKFHKGDELKVCQCTGLTFEHIVKDHFNHGNEELKNMHKQKKELICEIKGRKKHCYEEGYNAVAQA
jgi:hypothetical protein